MKEYSTAVEPRKVAREIVIPRWHEHLQEAAIAYIYDAEIMTSKGRAIMAKIRKANPVEHHLTGMDLIVLVSMPIWRTLEESQQIALMDHELSHVETTMKGTPPNHEVKYKLVGHDLEEFNEVVKRHGAWYPDIKEFYNSLLQGDLFAAGGGDAAEKEGG